METSRVLQLSFPERETVLMVLEEFINKLSIYQHTLRTKHSKDIAFDDIIPEIGCLETANMLLLNHDAQIAVKHLQEQAAYEKLIKDSSYIGSVMKQLKEQILADGRFDVFTEEIDRVAWREKEINAVFEECEKIEKDVTSLRKIIAEEKITRENEERRLRSKLLDTQNEMERWKRITDVKRRYVNSRSRVRREQNLLRHTMDIEELESTLKKCHIRKKNEARVTTELRAFFVQRAANFEEKTEEWQKRYDREKVVFDKQIYNVREDIDVRRKFVAELKEELRRKQSFVDAYLAEKEALRRQKESEDREREGAIRIQAWWRGVMVRRKLGPYRPEEKKKKRAAKTKK